MAVLQRFIALGFLRFSQVHVIHVEVVVDHGGTHGPWVTILKRTGGWNPIKVAEAKAACHGGSMLLYLLVGGLNPSEKY